MYWYSYWLYSCLFQILTETLETGEVSELLDDSGLFLQALMKRGSQLFSVSSVTRINLQYFILA